MKHVTPLKIIFSPRAGYAVVKTEAVNKGRHPTDIDNGVGDDIILKELTDNVVHLDSADSQTLK
mgnify:CR=1 FL=1